MDCRQIMEQFAHNHAYTSNTGERNMLPLSVCEYLRITHLQRMKKQEIAALGQELKPLKDPVTAYLRNMDGHQLDLRNLSNLESSLLGGRGQLKYTKRLRTVEPPCTRTVVGERLFASYRSAHPELKEDQCIHFVEHTLDYIWQALQPRVTEHWSLERTVPKVAEPGTEAVVPRRPRKSKKAAAAQAMAEAMF